jgi:hypothetical protein
MTTAVSVKQFWAKQGIPELNPPPPDFFLFPKIKSTRKGEDLKTRRTLKEKQQRNCWHYKQMTSKRVSNNFTS